MATKPPIGFTRSCWSCSLFKDAWGGKMDRQRNLWHCAACIKPKETVVPKEQPKKMSWSKGKPAAPGWYPTKMPQYAWANSYRWWDGQVWSWAAFPHEGADKAGRWSKKKETNFVSNQMEWSPMP